MEVRANRSSKMGYPMSFCKVFEFLSHLEFKSCPFYWFDPLDHNGEGRLPLYIYPFMQGHGTGSVEGSDT